MKLAIAVTMCIAILGGLAGISGALDDLIFLQSAVNSINWSAPITSIQPEQLTALFLGRAFTTVAGAIMGAITGLVIGVILEIAKLADNTIDIFGRPQVGL